MEIIGQFNFRKMEMVAGFHFLSDGTFQFYYSYGAVDRSATGTFSIEGNTLKLKSEKEPGNDFTVISQLKQSKGYSISFKHMHKYLLENIRCIFFIEGKQEEACTDNNGEVHVDFPKCEKIYAQHLLYPDIATLIKDTDNANNKFTASLNQSLEQVSFKGIDFTIEDEMTISCNPNYFMPIMNIRFEKA